MRRMSENGLYAFLLFTAALLSAAVATTTGAPSPTGSYVVVATRATFERPDWREAIEALRAKHEAGLILCETSVLESEIALREIFPDYVCFVCPPETLGRETVVGIHRMTRRLDDDPYTDLLWGILTGYDASDALRIARRREPLLVRRAAGSMGPGVFEGLEGGFASEETNPRAFWRRGAGEKAEKHDVTPDAAEALAGAFNTEDVDAFLTSGHATEKDWQIGYNVAGGQFRCEDGRLYALNTEGRRFDIRAERPKAYLPVGNCLIGRIPGPDCMATAWMHSGGVHQMFGYTAVTFHGFMGWGIGTFLHNPARNHTLAEAFFFNNQALVHRLQTRWPQQAAIEFESYEASAISELARRHRIADRTLLGDLWDRDVVAFYGDPAWPVRWAVGEAAWVQSWRREADGRRVFRIEVLRDTPWGDRPLCAFLPERLMNIRDLRFQGVPDALITDRFILLPAAGGQAKKGDIVEVSFGGDPAPIRKTSAGDDPVRAGARDPAARPPAVPRPDAALSLRVADPEMARALEAALRAAGSNVRSLAEALAGATEEEREDLLFLLVNMPLSDLRTLSGEYLLRNARFAAKARAETPWGKAAPLSLYRNYVLPYAAFSEKREEWREDFYRRFMPVIRDCASAGEAAVMLNREVFEQLGVRYHATRRPKPDQSPSESVAAGFASCTGLSILLVDACRAVAIPARVVGIPRWPDGSGNHNWVEIWDGAWQRLGAAESARLNEGWFIAKAAEAASRAHPDRPLERIYAATFERRPLRFMVAWDPYDDRISAVDVTSEYAAPAAAESPR